MSTTLEPLLRMGGIYRQAYRSISITMLSEKKGTKRSQWRRLRFHQGIMRWVRVTPTHKVQLHLQETL